MPWRICISIGNGERHMGRPDRRALPGHVRHAGHVDEDVVLAELARSASSSKVGAHANVPNHMKARWAGRARGRSPRTLVAGQVDLAAHDNGEQLVVGKEKMLLAGCPGRAYLKE